MPIVASNVIEYYGFELSSTLGLDPTLSRTEKCFKGILLGTNFVFLIFGIVLVSVGAVALSSQAGEFAGSTLPTGLIVLGVFIMLVSVLGVYAGWRENRLWLGVYFILLVVFAIILFAVGIAVYVEKDQASSLITSAWNSSPIGVQYDIQAIFSCCGLNNCTDSDIYTDANRLNGNGQPEYTQKCNFTSAGTCPSPFCLPTITNAFQSSYMSAGATGIAFGVLMLVYSGTICYLMIGIRKKKDILAVRDHHRKLREAKEDPGLTQAGIQLDQNIYDDQGNVIQMDEDMGGVNETNDAPTAHVHDNPEAYGFDANTESSQVHSEHDEHEDQHHHHEQNEDEHE